MKICPGGTPRTKPVVTNPILEIDEAVAAASCRSYDTVLQSAPCKIVPRRSVWN